MPLSGRVWCAQYWSPMMNTANCRGKKNKVNILILTYLPQLLYLPHSTTSSSKKQFMQRKQCAANAKSSKKRERKTKFFFWQFTLQQSAPWLYVLSSPPLLRTHPCNSEILPNSACAMSLLWRTQTRLISTKFNSYPTRQTNFDWILWL